MHCIHCIHKYMPCHAVPFHAIRYYTIHHIQHIPCMHCIYYIHKYIPCHAVSCHAMPCHTILHHNIYTVHWLHSLHSLNTWRALHTLHLPLLVICINQVLFMAMPLSVVGNAMSETWSDRHRILLVTRARRRLTLDFPMRNGDLTIKRMRYEPIIIRCSKQCFNWD